MSAAIKWHVAINQFNGDYEKEKVLIYRGKEAAEMEREQKLPQKHKHCSISPIEPCVFLQPPYRLVHFSKKPVDLVRSTKQQSVDSKPRGFWFSVEGNGDGWKHWCEAESFSLDRFGYENEIKLSEQANIIVLSSVFDIDIFHQEFKAPLLGMESERFESRYIDWRRVATKYHGIIIAPYVWERRLQGEAHHWYYSWDCASGCAWDRRAIREIKAAATTSTHGV